MAPSTHRRPRRRAPRTGSGGVVELLARLRCAAATFIYEGVAPAGHGR